MAILLTFKKKISSIIFQICPVFKVRRFIQKMQVGHVEMYGGYDAYSHIMENCEYFLKKEKLENMDNIQNSIPEAFKSVIEKIKLEIKYGARQTVSRASKFVKRLVKRCEC